MSTIKAILFDLDGTLFNRQNSIAAYAKQLFIDLNINDNDAFFTNTFLKLDNEGYSNKSEIYHSLQKQFALTCSEAWFLDHWSNNAWVHPQCNDHADALLTKIKHKGFKTGIITNGTSTFQRTKINNLHINDIVDVILISEEIGYTKPSYEIFSKAAAFLGVLNAECIYIGDSIEHDVKGSINAGMIGILYDKYNTCSNALFEKINNLNEIISYV